MSYFVKHEPCPKCHSRDNLARYSDGGAWCFGCGYREPPKHFAPPPLKGPITLPKLTKPLPATSLAWLTQWLTVEESDAFWWAPALQRHVYVVYDGEVPVFYEARSVTKTPKTLSFGEKPFLVLGSGWPLVIVEDIVSAIKVSRYTSCMPIFGSKLNEKQRKSIFRFFLSKGVRSGGVQGNCERLEVVIWLDYDKWSESVRLSGSLRHVGARSICTKEDPKASDVAKQLGLA